MNSKPIPAPRRATLLRGALFGLLLQACGPSRPAVRTPTQAELAARPVQVTGENVTDVLRELDEGTLGAAARPARDGAARYLATVGLERLGHGDTEGALRALRLALVHYTPEELGAGGLPSELAPLARGLLELVSQRGQEANALAMNRVLQALQPPDPQASERFSQIHDWGDRNRSQFRTPWTYRREMAQVYADVARTIAAPDVLHRALEYNIARRRAAQEAHQNPARGRLTMEDLEALENNLRRSSMDAALLFLRLGDLRGAVTASAQVGGSGPNSVSEVLRSVLEDPDPANKMAELAQQLERVDHSSMAGLCRLARHDHPRDPRFAQCLGAAAAAEGNWGLASAHLERAASLAPNNGLVLTRAMEVTRAWFEAAHTEDDPRPARRALERLRTLLDRWTQSNPRIPPPVTAGELERLAAELDLSHAELRSARQHLERAATASPPFRDAFLVLSELSWRERDAAGARRWLEQGAALPLGPSESDSTFRPLFALQRGQVARLANDAESARRELESAASSLEALGRSLQGPQRAHALLLRASALQALGGHDEEVRRALDSAQDLAPDSREMAGSAVTLLLSYGRFSDALELVRQARRRLNLDRPWQVYFSLWQLHLARVVEGSVDEDAQRSLRRLVERGPDPKPWTLWLAQRALGDLTREQLLAHATLPGQRAEALFYDALSELGAGDTAAAQRDFEGTVATNMVRYLEYSMAWQLLQLGSARWTPARSAAGAQAAAAPAPSGAAVAAPAAARPAAP